MNDQKEESRIKSRQDISKLKENNKQNDTSEINEEETKGLINVKIASLIIVILSLIAFIIIVYFTDLIGQRFGEAFEKYSLGAVALILIIAWYINNKSKDNR